MPLPAALHRKVDGSDDGGYLFFYISGRSCDQDLHLLSSLSVVETSFSLSTSLVVMNEGSGGCGVFLTE